MKMYYLGTVSSEKTFNNIVRKSKVKPSTAPQVFEDALLTGLATVEDLILELHTFPTIASFPSGNMLFIPPRKEKLKCGLTTRWLASINIQPFKQWGYSISTFFSLLKWCIRNRKETDKVVLCYSIYSFIAAPALFLAKKFNAKTVAVITDLPAHHFSSQKITGIRALFSGLFTNSSVKYQDKFDYYVLLTEQMNEVVNIHNKPYTIVEGISDEAAFNDVADVEKSMTKAVMYAGMINEKHRIGMIIEAFMQVQGEYELWLFGSGDFEKQVKEYAEKDARIKYFGRVDRKTVLEYEKKATLLVNVRDTEEEYTKYSFPSKTMEYCSSGTPLLTTKLAGIPSEYYEFLFTLETQTINGLAEKLREILSLENSVLNKMGEEARHFVLTHKNCYVQAKKIAELINTSQLEKVLQINSVCGTGSTGKIAVQIGKYLEQNGVESFIAYGDGNSDIGNTFKIGNYLDKHYHSFFSRKLCKQGYYSKLCTHRLIGYIKKIKPQIIHLHNIHGNYLNFKILFKYLKKSNTKVLWTLHDCWSFTGKCAHFTQANCYKWQTQCFACPQLLTYPESNGADRTKMCYNDKKKYFTSLKNLNIVTVSNWLASVTKQSFLAKYAIDVVYNGIDTDVFCPSISNIRSKYALENKFIILGVASIWNDRKGLLEFKALSKLIDNESVIVLVGLAEEQKNKLPQNIIGISKTESLKELVELYSAADVFINLSIEETFGLVTAEAMACGTPAIVYNSTACSEVLDESSGFVAEAGNINEVFNAVNTIKQNGKAAYSSYCRARIVNNFGKSTMLEGYMNTYKKILTKRM